MPPRTRSAAALTARSADRHVLYEASVQDTEADIHFIQRVYRKAHGRVPLRLREDFCGTARLCADWAASHPERQAIGLDLDQKTMDWGTARHLAPLGPAAKRVRLLRRNVLDGLRTKVDVAVAFNFSYCALRERDTLTTYCAGVRRSLAPGGAFFLDIHGGTECLEEMEETTRHRGFTYVWDQKAYDAVGGLGVRHIHFRFPDGTAIEPAFTYDWRLWQLPELRDVLASAGFARVEVYWEGADARGHGNGIFRKVRRAVNEQSWIAYVVAWRD